MYTVMDTQSYELQYLVYLQSVKNPRLQTIFVDKLITKAIQLTKMSEFWIIEEWIFNRKPKEV